MKKVQMVLGGIFLGILILGAVGVAIVAVKGSALDRESKQYVDTAIPAIAANWDIVEIQKRASPEFKAAVNNDDLEKLIRVFRKLGKFKSYNGAKGDANISVTTQNGKVISAAYVACADFENGPALIKLSLIKHGNEWQLRAYPKNCKIGSAGASPSRYGRDTFGKLSAGSVRLSRGSGIGS